MISRLRLHSSHLLQLNHHKSSQLALYMTKHACLYVVGCCQQHGPRATAPLRNLRSETGMKSSRSCWSSQPTRRRRYAGLQQRTLSCHSCSEVADHCAIVSSWYRRQSGPWQSRVSLMALSRQRAQSRRPSSGRDLSRCTHKPTSLCPMVRAPNRHLPLF